MQDAHQRVERKDFKGAAASFRRALEYEAHNLEARQGLEAYETLGWLQEAREQVTAGSPGKGISLYKKVLARDRQNAEAAAGVKQCEVLILLTDGKRKSGEKK